VHEVVKLSNDADTDRRAVFESLSRPIVKLAVKQALQGMEDERLPSW
jgi:hypothetical protein